jgi:hypothetical protein
MTQPIEGTEATLSGIGQPPLSAQDQALGTALSRSRSGLLNAADNVGLMDGTFLARQILAKTGERAARFKERAGRPPCFAVVLMGDDPVAVTYVKLKQARCRDAGVASRVVELHGAVTTAEALSLDPPIERVI